MNWMRKTIIEMNYKGMAIYSLIMGGILGLATNYIVDNQPNFAVTFLILILLIVSSVSCSVGRWTKANEKREVKK
ncbi:hypothetical protein [Bacillus sp. AG4(2022)]|uniref:hypothetical protein n=1 Tax=Bacillus sp. AG4(2022) TaxID=2962594 RepID=UPI0028818CEB|nr:hypothetical protein [Bacillus sp. AG4(2022)]MDT0163506.1 hypothetical protein [Bacillus sp. AG4(2022)]